MNGAAAELPDRRIPLGLLAFLATVTMLFAALTAAYLIRRTAADWRPVSLPRAAWGSAAFLVAGSVALEAARRTESRRWLLAAFGLGVLFAAGQLWTWKSLADSGVLLATTPHGSFFYVLSAVHGAHLLGGLAAILAAALRAAGLRACALYWHFMAGLWICVLAMLHVL